MGLELTEVENLAADGILQRGGPLTNTFVPNLIATTVDEASQIEIAVRQKACLIESNGGKICLVKNRVSPDQQSATNSQHSNPDLNIIPLTPERPSKELVLGLFWSLVATTRSNV